MRLASLPLDEFLDRLGSADPTPGGGALAALAGAMASSMLAMVGNLTVGRPRFASVEAQVRAILAELAECRERLARLADADADAYEAVAAARRLPRATEAELQARNEAIQVALRGATEVPTETMESTAQVLRLAVTTAEAGNPSVLPDVAVAAHLALAALRAAHEQARYNLASLKDVALFDELDGRVQDALRGGQADASRALEVVSQRTAATG